VAGFGAHIKKERLAKKEKLYRPASGILAGIPPAFPDWIMSEVTHLISAIQHGDSRASDQLLPLVYEELRKLAAQKIAQEQPGHTLQATALVHEAYLRLVDVEKPQEWDSRGHFFAAAAEAMRRILVESVRRKKSRKHGGHGERIPLDQIEIALPPPDDDLLALDEALTRLAAAKPAVAELVKLRFFAGLTMDEAAHALGISPATAYRHWNYAQAWLFRAMGKKE
jgi:RNA polymerase sigma factor (TIGR02999 family)